MKRLTLLTLSILRRFVAALVVLAALLGGCRQPPPEVRPPATANAAATAEAPATVDAAAATPAGQTQDQEAATQETTDMEEMTAGTVAAGSMHSQTLGEEIRYNVYLPPGYDTSESRYPLLYLLHGRGDDMQAWTIVKPLLDRMINDGEIPALIAMMPDAPFSQRGSYYVDSQYSVGFPTGQPVETAFIEDFLPHVDETYRTIAHREARAVGGYSMGGYGALRYALAHPELFMGALILSPAVYTPLPPSDSSVREFGAFGVENELFVEDVYRQKNYPALFEALAEQDLRLSFFIAVGDDEWKHPRAEDEAHDLDLEAHLLFNRAARVPNISAELRVLDGGHDWDVWAPAFAEGAPFLLRRMDLSAAAAGGGSPEGGGVTSDAPDTPAEGGATPTAEIEGDWSTLLGSAAEDLAGGLLGAGDGGLFVALAAGGAMGQQEHAGGKDVALLKIDANGETLWASQIGSRASERAYGLAPDGSGGVYVAGYTAGDLDGQHAGNDTDDAFVARFDGEGQLLWVTQFGQAETADRAYALAADAAGNAYLAGYSSGSLGADSAGDKDVILAKYAPDGQQLWLRQFGTWGEDKGLGLAVDAAGNVFVCGVVRGALGEPSGDFDAFLAAFDDEGQQQWVQQFGSRGWDQADAVVVGAQDDVYLTGLVAGDFAGPLAGDKDIFLARFSRRGELLAAEQFGSELNDKGADLLFNGGSLFLAGFSNGDLAGNQGKFDVIAARYTPDLQREWLRQWGSPADDGADAYAERNLYLAADGDGLALSGLTLGSVGGQAPLGAGDVFLWRLTP